MFKPNLQDSLGHQYPKLRVRSSFDFENQTAERPNLSNFDCIESVRSFDASQYSDGHSISSDDNYFQLPDLQKNLPVRISSPAISIVSGDAAKNDLDQKNVEDSIGDRCREVRCIESDDLTTNTHTHSTASSPAVSGLTEVDNRDKENLDLCSSGLKDNKEINGLQERFVLPSPEKISPCPTQSSASSSKTMKLTRSRSCKASLMRYPSSDWFDQEEMIQNAPPIGSEKDFTRRPEGLQRKTCTHHSNANAKRLSWAGYANSLGRASDVQNMKSSIDNGSYKDNSLPQGRNGKNDLESSNLQGNPEVCF